MNEWNKIIDESIYEITEAIYDSDIAFKKIDARYNTIKAITESTLDSSDIVLEEEEKSKNNDKKGVIRTLVDSIISKIQKILDAFKSKDESKKIDPEKEYKSDIDGSDIKKYGDQLELLGDKMDAMLTAAKGSDKEAYKKAVEEYDGLISDLRKTNKEMLNNVKEDIREYKDNNKKSHKFIKGVLIMTAIHKVRKTLKKARKNSETLKEYGINDSISDIFKNMFTDKNEAINAARELAVKCGLSATEGAGFDKVLDYILRREGINSTVEDIDKEYENSKKDDDKKSSDKKDNENDHKKDSDDKDSSDDENSSNDQKDNSDNSSNDSHNDSSDKDNDSNDSNNKDDSDDKNKDKDDSKKNDAGKDGDESLASFILKWGHGNLDEIATLKVVRPKFNESGKFAPYLLITKPGFFGKFFKKGDKIDKTLHKRVNGMKDKSQPPIFFDIWGLFWNDSNSKVPLNDYIEEQKKLLDQVNKIREEENMQKIHWDKNAANVAIKLITEGTPKNGHRYSWSHYLEDA